MHQKDLGKVNSSFRLSRKVAAPQVPEKAGAVAGNDIFLIKNITQNRKRFITQPKHMIFW